MIAPVALLAALAGQLPGFDGRRVLVASRMDSGPLPAPERPFRLLAPEDGGEHARRTRDVVAIRLRRD